MCLDKPLASLWVWTVRPSWQLVLFHHEYSYIRDLIRDNLCMAKQFSHTQVHKHSKKGHAKLFQKYWCTDAYTVGDIPPFGSKE